MSKETKFTPGPWSHEGPQHSIIVYGPEPEQRVCFMTSDGPAEANANLISAAPDMYEALSAAEQLYEIGVVDAPIELIRRVRASRIAALSKARGE